MGDCGHRPGCAFRVGIETRGLRYPDCVGGRGLQQTERSGAHRAWKARPTQQTAVSALMRKLQSTLLRAIFGVLSSERTARMSNTFHQCRCKPREVTGAVISMAAATDSPCVQYPEVAEGPYATLQSEMATSSGETERRRKRTNDERGCSDCEAGRRESV